MPEGMRGRILALALAAIALAVIWLGVIMPLVTWYGIRAGELDRQRLVLAHMQSAARSLPDLVRQVKASSSPEANLLSGATDAVAGAELQEMVQGMAAATGVTLSSIETLPAVAHDSYQQIGLRIVITAPYPALIKLLATISQDQQLMLIDDLQLRSELTLDHSMETPVSTSLDILAFWESPNNGSARLEHRLASDGNSP